MSEEIVTKKCIDCGVVYPMVTGFYKEPNNNDGHEHACKECDKKESKIRYQRRKIRDYERAVERQKLLTSLTNFALANSNLPGNPFAEIEDALAAGKLLGVPINQERAA